MKGWRSLLYLFFPHVCAGCSSPLASRSDALCFACVQHLPYTNFKVKLPVYFADKIDKDLKLEMVDSLLFFQKDTIVQQLLHQLKYSDHRQLAYVLGRLLGLQLQQKSTTFDFVVPIPLHLKKLKQRGYNQALFIAKGIAEVLQIPVNDKTLIRIKYTESQTRKSLSERTKNVEGAFYLKQINKFDNKSVLLVDDVFTTGATLRSASQSLMHNSSNCKLSWATVAIALSD